MALIAVSFMNYSTAAVPSLVAASASDTFAMPSQAGQRFAVYRNGNAATRTITVVNSTDLDVYGRAIADLSYTLAVTGTFAGELWIPLIGAMADATGIITITCSPAVTNVTVGHIEIA